MENWKSKDVLSPITHINQKNITSFVKVQTKSDYESLLKRLQDKLGNESRKAVSRLEVPTPQIIWVGQRTIFRNFMEFPKALRREPAKLLLYLNKELASAGYIAGERVIFLGRKEPSSFGALIDRYVKDYVICPVCGSPDTRTEKNKKLGFLLCEACGARSSIKANYAWTKILYSYKPLYSILCNYFYIAWLHFYNRRSNLEILQGVRLRSICK